MAEHNITIIGSMVENYDGIMDAKDKIGRTFIPFVTPLIKYHQNGGSGYFISEVEINIPYPLKRSEWAPNVIMDWLKTLKGSDFIVLVRNPDGGISRDSVSDICFANSHSIPIIEFYNIDNFLFEKIDGGEE